LKLDPIVVVALVNGIFSLLAIIMPFVANIWQNRAGMRQAVRTLLYSDLERRCLLYIQQGFITAKEFKMLVEDWDVYHKKLKGNGYLDELVSQVKGLPIQN